MTKTIFQQHSKIFFPTVFLIVSVTILAQVNFAQSSDLEQQIKQMVLTAGEAERTLDIVKFAVLTTNNFSESQTTGAGTTTKSKSQILNELRKAPEGFKKVFSMVKVETEITGVSVKKFGNTAEFKFLLTERSFLKTVNGTQTEEFKKVER